MRRDRLKEPCERCGLERKQVGETASVRIAGVRRRLCARCEEAGKWQSPPEERRLSCWEASPDGAATCLLPLGHAGRHHFTPDDQIMIHFKEESPEER